MHHDVIVIGGSYAGMAAALQLVRARRTVLVVDAGVRRNRFASHSHGFLGQDGVSPGDIAANARRQLQNYPTLTWLDAKAETATGEVDGFTVATSDGGLHQGRRILLATGVTDRLPAIDGIVERWGKSVFHCPYCHGYELDRGRIGVIASGPLSVHQAELLVDWGEVTLLVNGAVELSPETRSALEQRSVRVEEGAIDRIEGHADVVVVDGRRLRFSGLFIAPYTSPASSLAETMGCALDELPMGSQVSADAECKTSVVGVFACGDAARAPHSVSLAVGNGAMAGIHVHRSLLWPETVIPVRTGGRTS